MDVSDRSHTLCFPPLTLTPAAQLLRLPPTLAALVATFALTTFAQYPPPASYQNILTSPLNSNITVAYKQPPAGTCTTAFTTQKQYTGYIGIPPYTLAPIQQNYSVNTFFWFVEARQTPETAPLTVWLNGGPGSSSMVGFFNEVGPCEVVQTTDGSYGTQYRMYGWDRASNMLFIDQPNQVGFSYDSTTNASYDLLHDEVFEPLTAPSAGLPGFMYLNGTFGTANEENGSSYSTANTTEIAAETIWHFLQSWLAAFPQYNPATRPNVTRPITSSVPAGVNLFTESYGGHYAPAFANFFEQQNQRRRNGSIPSNSTLAINLESVGIMNGLVDDLIQDYYYPLFAYNNTYGIEAISSTVELNTISQYSAQCVTAIQSCRAAMNSTDAEGYGDVASTNTLCEAAQLTCANTTASYASAGYDVYDIRQKLPSPDPPAAYQEYLNNASVLAAIGARVNYTESNPYVQHAFISTGDTIRGGGIQDLAYLLSLGIRVALIYGDADFICNWYGGEAISLAIAQQMAGMNPSTLALNAPSSTVLPATYASAFPAAGYSEIVVNNSYIGGEVRQFGNLSFSRVYDSGHFVPYFQPETAFTIFARVLGGTEVATGEPIDLSTYSTTGSANSSYVNAVPPAPSPTCWVRSWNATCSASDTQAMLAGSGVVANGIFYQDSDSVSLPHSSVAAGVPGSPLSSSSTIGAGPAKSNGGSSTELTGVYTATSTPSPTGKGGAAGVRPARWAWAGEGPLLAFVLSCTMGLVMML